MELGIQHPCRFRSEQILKWVDSNWRGQKDLFSMPWVDVSELHIISLILIRFGSWLPVHRLSTKVLTYFMNFVGVVWLSL